MTPENARYLALGYMWASEDTSGKATSEPEDGRLYQFSEAFAQGWEDYNTGKRGTMIPVKYAYENWQVSGGRSIFTAGDETKDRVSPETSESTEG